MSNQNGYFTNLKDKLVNLNSLKNHVFLVVKQTHGLVANTSKVKTKRPKKGEKDHPISL